MSTKRISILLLSVAHISACAHRSDDESDQVAADPVPELTPEQLELLDKPLAQQDRGFVILPPGSQSLDNPSDYTGEWVVRNGVRECDGYLTRFEDKDYCSAQVPNDWVPFEFEGKVYYFQPLASNDF